MNVLKKIKVIINAFKLYRVFYTIYFNFKYLPVEQAKKLPILFHKSSFGKISKGGRIVLTDDFMKNKCKIQVGLHSHDFEYECEKTYLNIQGGSLTVKGSLCLRRGVLFDIRGNAETNEDVLFGPRCRVRIHNKASFGSFVRIAHETQVFDSNFHFSEKVDAPGYYPISKPIKVGSYCWVGNRCTLNPGTVIPDYTTVASNSLVNKDFSNLNSYSIIGGTPAKFIKEGFSRVWDTKRETEYQKREFPWF